MCWEIFHHDLSIRNRALTAMSMYNCTLERQIFKESKRFKKKFSNLPSMFRTAYDRGFFL